MTFVVTSRGEPIGTSELEHLDHHFYCAQGVFSPANTFDRLRPIFETAPEGLWLYDLFGECLADTGELDDSYRAFCNTRDALRLTLRTPTGAVPGSRVVGIARIAGRDAWELLVSTDGAAAFERIARIHYVHAPETFARFARPWTAPAVRREPPAGAMEVLARGHRNNPIFIGPAGPMRERLLADTAGLLLAGEGDALAGWRVAMLDVDALLALARWDEACETLRAVAWHAYQARPRTLFVIDRFDELMPWAAATLKPLLARGQMRFIGTANLEGYRKKIEKDAAIHRRVQEIITWTP